MVELLLQTIFAGVIIAAVIAYFWRRQKKLERMALRDKIDDMFRFDQESHRR
jgi:hypothetical protein